MKSYRIIRCMNRFLVMLAMFCGEGALAGDSLGSEVASVAADYLENRPKLRVEACNGLIEDVLRDVGTELRGNVRYLFASMDDQGWVHRRKVPFPGDIVYFDKTYDLNENGRQDDKLTHIAIVIRVDADGTAHLVHRGSKGITPLAINLKSPSTHQDANGKVINSYLVRKGYGRDGARLAGEVWAAWASPGGKPKEKVVAQKPPVRAKPVRSTDLPMAWEDKGLQRVWKGRSLRKRDLAGRSCEEYWFMRNAVAARHGYVFSDPDLTVLFGSLAAYRADRSISPQTIGRVLSAKDRENIAQILSAEASCR